VGKARREIKECLFKKPQGKRPYPRRMHRCEDNIKIDLRLLSSNSGWGPMARFCEHGNESSSPI
jgi:hypothetical protein